MKQASRSREERSLDRPIFACKEVKSSYTVPLSAQREGVAPRQFTALVKSLLSPSVRERHSRRIIGSLHKLASLGLSRWPDLAQYTSVPKERNRTVVTSRYVRAPQVALCDGFLSSRLTLGSLTLSRFSPFTTHDSTDREPFAYCFHGFQKRSSYRSSSSEASVSLSSRAWYSGWCDPSNTPLKSFGNILCYQFY